MELLSSLVILFYIAAFIAAAFFLHRKDLRKHLLWGLVYAAVSGVFGMLPGQEGPGEGPPSLNFIVGLGVGFMFLVFLVVIWGSGVAFLSWRRKEYDNDLMFGFYGLSSLIWFGALGLSAVLRSLMEGNVFSALRGSAIIFLPPLMLLGPVVYRAYRRLSEKREG